MLEKYLIPKGIKQYNKLRSENTGRKFLFLLQLPENQEEWLHISEEQLLFKRRFMYG